MADQNIILTPKRYWTPKALNRRLSRGSWLVHESTSLLACMLLKSSSGDDEVVIEADGKSQRNSPAFYTPTDKNIVMAMRLNIVFMERR